MAAAALAELERPDPKRRFTVGITDDVTHLSLEVDRSFTTEPDDVVRAVFYGLGADGTVGANRNSIKIIGGHRGPLRSGLLRARLQEGRLDDRLPPPLRSASDQLDVSRAGGRLRRLPPVRVARADRRARPGRRRRHVPAQRAVRRRTRSGSTFPPTCRSRSSRSASASSSSTRRSVAREAGLGKRVNTVLQTCFFALSDVLPLERGDRRDQGARSATTYAQARRGGARAELRRGRPRARGAQRGRRCPPTVTLRDEPAGPSCRASAPDVRARRHGADARRARATTLPVSALPVDGTFPTGTAQYEKRSIADEIPIWDPSICIDCAKCALVCPHAAIRMKVFAARGARQARPRASSRRSGRRRDLPGMLMTIQVAPDDCTGCGICVEICPAHSKEEVRHKSINLEPKAEHLEVERERYEFFLSIPEIDRDARRAGNREGLSDAPAALRVLRGLRGLRRDALPQAADPALRRSAARRERDRLLVDLRRQPADDAVVAEPQTGRGPAWSNSLFEDNAEFGLGMRLASTQQQAAGRVPARDGGRTRPRAARSSQRTRRRSRASPPSAHASPSSRHVAARSTRRRRAGSSPWRARSSARASGSSAATAGPTTSASAGLDHVLASGRDVNVLVLDTEVYSNTGGQASKATPRGGSGEVRSGREADPQEGPRHDRVRVRRRLRRADRDGRRQPADREGPRRGRRLPRAVARDRVQPLHRARDRDEEGDGAAEARRRHRLLAALPLRPAALPRGRASLPARLAPRRSCPSPSSCRARHASRCSRGRAPPTRRSWPTLAQHDVDERWHVYEQMAEIEHEPETAGEEES